MAHTVHADDDDGDDDDDDSDDSGYQNGAGPAERLSLFHDDSPGTCGEINKSHARRMDFDLSVLEAVAHAGDPLLARRAYDTFNLADEKGTPLPDFDKAAAPHQQWAASHPELVQWLADPAHARSFAELHLTVDGDGPDRLLQAASSAGDPLLLEQLHPLVSDDEITRYHANWVQNHPQFVAEMSDPAKAKKVVDDQLAILRGTDDEHRAWYAARHAMQPSLAARTRDALMLDTVQRKTLFDPAQETWEAAHRAELPRLEGEPASALVAKLVGVHPAPATGSDDDHVLYAAAVASGDAALISKARRQLGIADLEGATDKAEPFEQAHQDWEATHADLVQPYRDKAAAATYAQAHVKAPALSYPEDRLQLYVAAQHMPNTGQATSNFLKASKIAGKCDIYKLVAEAKVYATERPDFVATVDTSDKAAAYFNARVSAAAYTDPHSFEGIAVTIGLGIAFGLSSTTYCPYGSPGCMPSFNSHGVGIASGTVPAELDIEYRTSPTLAFGAFASFGPFSCDSRYDCGFFSAFNVRVGGEIGYNARPFSRWEPWIHAGLGWSHYYVNVTDTEQTNPLFDQVLDYQDGLDLHVRANATVVRSGIYRAGPFAALQISTWSPGFTVFAIGFSGTVAP